MRNRFILFFPLFAIAFCAYGQAIQVVSLEVINLEEDKGPFATMNDEVFCIQGSYDVQMDSLLSWEHSNIFELSDSLPEALLNFERPLDIDTHKMWLVMLIEMDTERSAILISEKIKSVFLEYASYPSTLLKEKIRLQMGDDDLLGFLYLSQKQVQKLDLAIRFKGMHMFNRYEYLLQLEIKN